jgi:glycosyltransferase involved in cell wall biosynthesis
VAAPTISVCVSSKNRATHLPRLVAHLATQDIPHDQFEVIVVDDGSTDETAAVLDELAATAPFSLRVLRNDSSRGPAAGRNRAWREARAEVCAFTDDDCLPTPTWLSGILAVIGAGPAVVAGRILPPPAEEHRIGPFSRILVASTGYAGWAAAANLAVRREDLLAVGGFDEDFRNPAGEDTDLALRLMAHGLPFVYAPDAVVLHHVEQTGVRGLVRDQQRWIDVPAVFARHRWARRQLLSHGVFWKSTHPWVLLVVVAAGLAPLRRTALVLTVPWLHERLCRQPVTERFGERLTSLPGVLVLDVSEVAVMVRGSLRHRELVL